MKTIYYRGGIKSCNYRCSYCPFSKNPHSQKQIERDRNALAAFCRAAEAYEGVGIMFLPYGEALTHNYYLEQIGTLTRRDGVPYVACQTNLSFDIALLSDYGIDAGKLKLWCSFHPSQTTVEDFVSQCTKLSEHGVSFCVGAVGDPAALPVIRSLRSRLAPEYYLWINRMDGKRSPYTDDESAHFSDIDPLFSMELKHVKADINCCSAGKDAFFINEKGDVFACNISRIPMGNIYQQSLETMTERGCRAKACSCYLAYSNRTDLELLEVFGPNKAFRIPNLALIAYFFDIDGTLTDKNGLISPDKQAAIRRLARTAKIYLATSLPYQHAYKVCKNIWEWIDGGSFAEGSDIRIFSRQYQKVIPLEPEFELPEEGIRAYSQNGTLHKVTAREGGKLEALINPDEYHLVYEDGRVGITDKSAGKLQGIIHICEQMRYAADRVAVVGNSVNDIEMLRYFRHSFAVEDSDEEVKQAAKCVKRIEELHGIQTGNIM